LTRLSQRAGGSDLHYLRVIVAEVPLNLNCIGANLARMAIKLIFNEIAD